MLARLTVVLVLVSGCSSQPSYCDIRSSSCRESIFFAVLDARGDPWDANSASPPSQVITEAQYRSQLQAQAAASGGAHPWDPPLTVLDLLVPSSTSTEAQIEDQVTNTAAFYSGSTGKISVIDHGTPKDDASDSFVLAHELVHAIQDRDHGLVAVQNSATSADMGFARTSLVEGEAVLYSNLVSLRIRGLDPEHVDWTTYWTHMVTGTDSALDQASARLDTALWLYVYPVGGKRLTETYLARGNTGVRELWRHPPDETLGLLTDLGEAAPAPEALTCQRPTPPPGTAAVLMGGQLGPIGLYAMAEGRWTSLPPSAWTFIQRWRGDSLWGFDSASTTGNVAVYRVRLADESSAATLASAIAGYQSTHTWRVENVGREVTLAASDDPTLLDTWTGWRCQNQ